MAARFIGLDGEMTGSGTPHSPVSPAEKFQLIQIGLAQMPDEVFTSDIGYKQYAYQVESLEVNGFSHERIKAGPGPKSVDTFVIGWLEKHGLYGQRLTPVGFGVSYFDMPFIRKYLPLLAAQLTPTSVELGTLCMSLSKAGYGNAKTIKKQSKKYAEARIQEQGLDIQWHDAGFDALAALYSWEFLTAKIAA